MSCVRAGRLDPLHGRERLAWALSGVLVDALACDPDLEVLDVGDDRKALEVHARHLYGEVFRGRVYVH